MVSPGLRLRQTREALGLTYRDVEKASYQIAVNRGRPDFILHISRLADIENRGVVPSLHKLYSLAAILHLDPAEISDWYDAPFRQTFHEGASFPPPRTSLSSFPVPPVSLRAGIALWNQKPPNCSSGGPPPSFPFRRSTRRPTANTVTATLDCPIGE